MNKLQALLAKFRAAAPGDTASEAASEEAAELISYKAMQTLLGQAKVSLEEASSHVEDLISDEEDNPTATANDEAAEEEVETARLEAIQMLCYSMTSVIQNVLSLTYVQLAPELPAPGDVSRYAEVLRDAIGKSISAVNMKKIQSAHDASHDMHGHTVALGASCNGMKLLSDKPCGCHAAEGEDEMNKETRAATIKALVENKDTGLTADDSKWLEAVPDERLEALAEQAKGGALRVAASKADSEKIIKDKHTADSALAMHAATLKAADDKKAAADADKPEPKAASAPTEEEWMKTAPPSIKALVERQRKADDEQKAEFVTNLKAAQDVYSEDELKAMSLDELGRMARLVKVETAPVSYAGRGVPASQPRAAADKNDVFANPPDPYKLALAARQKVS